MTGVDPYRPRVLIGGVGLPWRRDLDLGRLLIAEMENGEWPDGVVVQDLSYSAHRVMHTLQSIQPQKLVLVGASAKGRPPGEITRYRVDTSEPLDPEDVAARLGESVGGVIDLDHVVIVNRHFGSFPSDTVVIDVEVGDDRFGVGYSDEVEEVVPRILKLIQEEI